MGEKAEKRWLNKLIELERKKHDILTKKDQEKLETLAKMRKKVLIPNKLEGHNPYFKEYGKDGVITNPITKSNPFSRTMSRVLSFLELHCPKS